jgi:hypothetical protein
MAIDTERTEPRSRRAVLAGALGGVAAVLASRFGSPDRTSAAAGGPVVMGAANSAGTTNTSLATSSTGVAYLVTQNGTGTALRGIANNGIAGFFTSANGTGVSGVTAKNNQFGVYGANDAIAYGGGEAIRANGQQNHGLVATSADTAAIAVKAIHSGVNGKAIVGQATATTGSNGQAVAGQADGQNGIGVYGLATSATGTPIGVAGTSQAPAGNAVYGQMLAGSYGNGVAVRADGGVNHGLVASTAYEGANAVKATNSAVNGTAIRGEATAPAAVGIAMAVQGEITGYGYAVYGHAGAASGPTFGVYGTVDSDTGVGASGIATSGSGANIGVYGETVSPTGHGVYSYGNAHVEGNLDVVGTISAGTKDFRIDHPHDPANKFLSHSCVESDARRTVYDGAVTLDGRGEATVNLPSWFDALNGQTRIQLTPIGPTERIVYVKSEVSNNRFAVAGGAPGQKIYWQVTGIRHDAYAKAHPLAVEAAKTGTEKGRYLHPEVYGKAASKSIGALRTRPRPAADRTPPSAPAPGH